MNYIALDDVVHNEDRLCIYCKLDLNVGATYAAKKQVNGQITSLKCETLIEAITWVGFGELGQALFNSPKFVKKFKAKFDQIVNDKLIILRLNGSSFYLVNDQDTWSKYSSIKELPYLESPEIQQAISNVMGQNFVQDQENFISQEAELSANLKGTLAEMRKLNKDIAEGNIQSTATASEELRVVDINESACSIVY